MFSFAEMNTDFASEISLDRTTDILHYTPFPLVFWNFKSINGQYKLVKLGYKLDNS
jgi:hypothetical protein